MLTKTRWPYPRIIAHRGAGVLAPENTLVALRLAASFGFAGVEVDARVARSGTTFLLHDDTLERTTDGQGPAIDLTADELARLDAGVWFGNEFAGEHVPTLSSACALCQNLGQWMNVEIKASPDSAYDDGRLIAAQVAGRWGSASPSPLVSSFSQAALAGAAVGAPALPRGLLLDTPGEDWIARARDLGCASVHVRHDALSAPLVADAHEAGLAVLAFTVNEAGRALTLFDWGVDAIVTDELRDIRADFLSVYGVG